MLDHIEIYVSDLERSTRFWTPFLAHLGFHEKVWSGGVSYYGEAEPYLSLLPAPPDHREPGFHRRRVGLNHLAFRATSRAHVDEITAWVESAGYTVLYADRHPFAESPDYYALFCEDPDRIKVEVVAPFET